MGEVCCPAIELCECEGCVSSISGVRSGALMEALRGLWHEQAGSWRGELEETLRSWKK